MLRQNGNIDSGIESESECETSSVVLVVEIGDSVLTSRDDSLDVVNNKTTTEETFELLTTTGERLVVSFDTICDYERQCLPEFFDYKEKGKNSEKYLLIRNHFINHWKRVSPKRFGYHELIKRVSHLHLGNVTAFSRVQKFLESHHVINNVGGVKKKMTSSIKRKRKEGESSSVPMSRTRPNPFKLVPLETFDDNTNAPFIVKLSMEALAIIDIHAHCVKTEVIGLLGGRYCNNRKELTIMTSEPCHSLDDHDLQCDMEPVSQALAKEALEEKEYHVVGWYHSHPTFIPLPSLRDLETQNNFQKLFSEEKRPFVALILSPYFIGNQTLSSQFKCFWLSENSEFRIPFELKPKIVRTDKLVYHVCHKLIQLCQMISNHSSRIQMNERLKRFKLNGNQDLTHKQKLMESLSYFLLKCGLSSRESQHLLFKIQSIIEFRA